MTLNSNLSKRPSTPCPAFIVTGHEETISNSVFSFPDDDSTLFQDDCVGQGLDLILASISLARRGEYNLALQSFDSTMNELRALLPPNHPNLGDVYFGIGLLNKMLFNHKESILHFEKAQDIYQNALRDRQLIKDTPSQKIEFYLLSRLFYVLSHLGSVLFTIREYRVAEDYFNEALVVAKRSAVSALYIDRNCPIQGISVVKKARINVTECFNNLASLCAESGKRSAAISQYNEALTLQIQELGEVDPRVAIVLYNIGTMHYRSGQYNLALKSYRQVLKMRKNLFGSRHSSNTEVLLDIATTHEKLREFKEAKSAFNAARSILMTHNGDKHIDIGRISFRIGAMHARNGEVASALESLNFALDLYQKLGLESSDDDVQAANDAIQYVKGQTDISPFSQYIDTLVKDNCSTLQQSINMKSFDHTISDDDRDDIVDEIYRLQFIS